MKTALKSFWIGFTKTYRHINWEIVGENTHFTIVWVSLMVTFLSILAGLLVLIAKTQ